MHSRIFQTSDKPIHEDDLISIEEMYDRPNDYSDYVDESDTISDLKWLQSSYENIIKIDLDAKTITLTNKKQHMLTTLTSLAKTTSKLMTAIIEMMSEIVKGNLTKENNDISYLIWNVRSAYEDKFGFHIIDPRYGDITFDEWLFKYGNDNDILYVGNTFDYHM